MMGNGHMPFAGHEKAGISSILGNLKEAAESPAHSFSPGMNGGGAQEQKGALGFSELSHALALTGSSYTQPLAMPLLGISTESNSHTCCLEPLISLPTRICCGL